MPKVNKLSDVSMNTMHATSTPILAIVARMAVTELEHRAGLAAETLAAMARGNITAVEQLVLIPPRRTKRVLAPQPSTRKE